MNKTSRRLVAIAVLCLALCLLTACAQRQVEGVEYTRPDKNTLVFQMNGNTWTRVAAGRTAEIFRDDVLVARVTGLAMDVELSGDRRATVGIARDGLPTQVTVELNTTIGAADYTVITQAAQVNRLGLQVIGSPAGAIIWIVILLVLATLIIVFNKRLTLLVGSNNTKQGRIIVWSAAAVLVVIALIILLILVT